MPQLVVSSVLDIVPQKMIFFRSSCQFMALCCNWFGFFGSGLLVVSIKSGCHGCVVDNEGFRFPT